TPDKNVSNFDQTFRNARMRHNRTEHDEKWNGKQRSVLRWANKALNGNRNRHWVEENKICKYGNENADIKAHVKRDKRQHDKNDNCQVHTLPPANAARKDLKAPENI